jgi:hypothetical protein
MCPIDQLVQINSPSPPALEDPAKIFAELTQNGLTGLLIDSGSCRVGTSFKSYCQFASWPQFGILFSHVIADDSDEHPRALGEIEQRLQKETKYLSAFAQLGAPVIQFYAASSGTPVIKFIDNRDDFPKQAAGLVVQHVAGIGPFHISYQYRELWDAVRARGREIEAIARADYDDICKASLQRCPHDLQVMLTEPGNLIVLDIEKFGTGRSLPPWPDQSSNG